MGRQTFRKVITKDEIWEQVNTKNKKLIERFLKEKTTRCSTTTIQNYTSDLHIFFTWNYLENDDKFFVNIKKLDFSDFFSYCVTKLKWGSARFARMRSCLSSISEFIIKFYDEEYPTYRNLILSSIESMPKEPRRKKTILSEEQINNLLKHLSVDLNNAQESCLLALAISSGARKSELLRFDINLIDENNTAFEGLFIETKEKIRTKGRKDGKYIYKYIIKDMFIPYYNKWLEERKKILEKNGVEEHNKLFIKRNGQPIENTSTLDYWIEKWEEFLGVPFYMHSLRHYLCTYLSRLSLEQDLIVEIYGWSDATMCKIYNDLTAKDRKWKGTEKLKNALNLSENDKLNESSTNQESQPTQ